jgi:hypothetical protein
LREFKDGGCSANQTAIEKCNKEAEETSHLELLYPEAPPMPGDCQGEGPAICSDEFLEQEYGNLPAVTEAHVCSPCAVADTGDIPYASCDGCESSGGTQAENAGGGVPLVGAPSGHGGGHVTDPGKGDASGNTKKKAAKKFNKDNGKAWKWVKFTPEKLRDENSANSVQIAEILFRYKGDNVEALSAENPGGDTPSGEDASKAIDGDVNTKWLDFNKGYLRVKFKKLSRIDEFAFITAGDHPERDPVRWKLEGSVDDKEWETIQEQILDYNTPYERDTSIPWIPLGKAGDPADSAEVLSDLICPPGSEQVGEFNADIGGCGLESCDARYDVETIEACEQKCRANLQCRSFTWAPLGGDQNHVESEVCTIYAEDVPTSTWGPEQIFCKMQAGSCTRPEGWCTHGGSNYLMLDCDGDGVADPYCKDVNGQSGFRSSVTHCLDTWPQGTCQECTITLFQRNNYHGWHAVFPKGTYNKADLIARGAEDDEVSSIKVGQHCAVTLYQHDNYNGIGVTFTPGDYDHAAMFECRFLRQRGEQHPRLPRERRGFAGFGRG